MEEKLVGLLIAGLCTRPHESQVTMVQWYAALLASNAGRLTARFNTRWR